MENEIKLGDMVRDKLTGYEGIVEATVNYLYGCKQYQVRAICNDDNKNGDYPKASWIDEPQLEKIAETGEKEPDTPSYGGNRSHP